MRSAIVQQKAELKFRNLYLPNHRRRHGNKLNQQDTQFFLYVTLVMSFSIYTGANKYKKL